MPQVPMSSSVIDVPVRAVGSNLLSPVATPPNSMSPATVQVIAVVVGSTPTVVCPATSSRTDVYPACAFALATIRTIGRPSVLGQEMVSADSVGGSRRYHIAAEHSPAPWLSPALVSSTSL